MTFTTAISDRIESSVLRVADVRNFSCDFEDGKATIRGQVSAREDSLMCSIVVQMIPGVKSVTNELQVKA